MFSYYANFDKKLTYGNSYDFGNFDQCLDIRHESHVDVIIGKYCLVQYYSTQADFIEIPPGNTKSIQNCIVKSIKLKKFQLKVATIEGGKI